MDPYTPATSPSPSFVALRCFKLPISFAAPLTFISALFLTTTLSFRRTAGRALSAVSDFAISSDTPDMASWRIFSFLSACSCAIRCASSASASAAAFFLDSSASASSFRFFSKRASSSKARCCASAFARFLAIFFIALSCAFLAAISKASIASSDCFASTSLSSLSFVPPPPLLSSTASIKFTVVLRRSSSAATFLS